ncbi:hypothetical protein [Aeromonas enteropelogenes]|uniref:hypothetical protein n=1 Tax=Aeromonas enteropelogenes TaxID=29489 RepID=UPI003BA1B428
MNTLINVSIFIDVLISLSTAVFIFCVWAAYKLQKLKADNFNIKGYILFAQVCLLVYGVYGIYDEYESVKKERTPPVIKSSFYDYDNNSEY